MLKQRVPLLHFSAFQFIYLLICPGAAHSHSRAMLCSLTFCYLTVLFLSPLNASEVQTCLTWIKPQCHWLICSRSLEYIRDEASVLHSKYVTSQVSAECVNSSRFLSVSTLHHTIIQAPFRLQMNLISSQIQFLGQMGSKSVQTGQHDRPI